VIPHAAQLDAAYGTEVWRPITRVTLKTPDATGTRYTNVVADVVDGWLTSSSTAWPRTSLEMTLPTAVIPSATVLPTHPWGSLVIVEAGAVIGTEEYTFQVCELDVTEVIVRRPAGLIEVRAVSHEARVNECRVPQTLGTYSNVASLPVALSVAEAFGIPFASLPYTNTLTNDVTDVSTQTQGDRWPAIEDLMDQVDGEAVFDHLGRLLLRDVPVKGTPDITIKTGDGGTLLDYRSIRRWAASRAQITYVLNSTGAETVATASKTSGFLDVDGPYGVHTRWETRNVDTLPSATARGRHAAALLKRASAPLRRVELQAIPAPWIEPGDTVRVQLLGETTEDHLVTGVRWPLTQLEPMNLTTQDSDYT
jgi:hypothetical protein